MMQLVFVYLKKSDFTRIDFLPMQNGALTWFCQMRFVYFPDKGELYFGVVPEGESPLGELERIDGIQFDQRWTTRVRDFAQV